MTLFRLRDDVPTLRAPVLVGAFDGWIDAGGAASTAAGRLAEGAETVATVEPDSLFDYRSRRPVLDVVDGTLRRLSWPEIVVAHLALEERDVLVLHGPEPDFRWQELAGAAAEIALRLGVLQWVSLGAIPAAVPHTRPVPVFGTASADGLLASDVEKGPEGLLRVPAAALSVIEMAMDGAGIPTVGFYAQVPHYVGGPFAPAAIGLLDQLGRHLSVDLPLGELADDALSQRTRLDAAVGADDDAREYLERLESMDADERTIPSGDELASEIERFLQGETGDDPPRL
jgi:hypothetical protein